MQGTGSVVGGRVLGDKPLHGSTERMCVMGLNA